MARESGAGEWSGRGSGRVQVPRRSAASCHNTWRPAPPLHTFAPPPPSPQSLPHTRPSHTPLTRAPHTHAPHTPLTRSPLERLTECDVWLFPTIVRLDAMYGPLFKCSRRRIFGCSSPAAARPAAAGTAVARGHGAAAAAVAAAAVGCGGDYPHLAGWARDIWQLQVPGSLVQVRGCGGCVCGGGCRYQPKLNETSGAQAKEIVASDNTYGRWIEGRYQRHLQPRAPAHCRANALHICTAFCCILCKCKQAPSHLPNAVIFLQHNALALFLPDFRHAGSGRGAALLLQLAVPAQPGRHRAGRSHRRRPATGQQGAGAGGQQCAGGGVPPAAGGGVRGRRGGGEEGRGGGGVPPAAAGGVSGEEEATGEQGEA